MIETFDEKVVFLILGQSTYKSESNNIEYVGIEFELSGYALVHYSTDWNSGRPVILSICKKVDDGGIRSKLYCESSSTISIEAVTGILYTGTYRCYCRREMGSTNNSNAYVVIGHVFR